MNRTCLICGNSLPKLPTHRKYCRQSCADQARKMNRYNKQILDVLKRQEQKGIPKYGQILEENTDGILARLNHLEEELADGLRYLQWLKDWVEGLQQLK